MASTAHDLRVRELQAELFAEDLTPPAEAAEWEEAELRAFFETGGGVAPQNARLLAALRGESSRPPPARASAATDPDGPWGAAACGVAIRPCDDNPHKGLGAFATAPIARGSVAGVYWGEGLSAAAYRRRHDPNRRRDGGSDAEARAAAGERRRRLAALGGGGPMGGADNDGAYVVALASEPTVSLAEREDPDWPVYIDAEDPERSSWCRYVNHASTYEDACNLELQVDGVEGLAWLRATRDIPVGAELCFDYGPRFDVVSASAAHRASGVNA